MKSAEPIAVVFDEIAARISSFGVSGARFQVAELKLGTRIKKRLSRSRADNKEGNEQHEKSPSGPDGLFASSTVRLA